MWWLEGSGPTPSWCQTVVGKGGLLLSTEAPGGSTAGWVGGRGGGGASPSECGGGEEAAMQARWSGS